MSTKNKKKIIYLITKSNWGGAQRYVYDLATSLPKDEFDVLVMLGGEGTLKHKLQKAGIRTYSIPNLVRDIRPLDEVRVLRTIVSILRKEAPDAIHVNSSKIGGLGALAGRIAGVPKIVFTAHGWPFNERVSMLKTAVMYLFSWLTMILSTRTITIAKKDYGQGLRMLGGSRKIVFIPNGIAVPEFQTKEIARAFFMSRMPEVGEVAESPWIAAICELHFNKGLPYLLEAFALLKKRLGAARCPRCIIMGDGELRSELERRRKQLGIEDVVFFAGYVDDASTYLAAFDGFVLPSLKEGLPYTILEAGSAGLPVVATSVGGIPDLIVPEVSGLLVPPGNAEALADALEAFVKNPGKVKGYGTALQNHLKQEGSIEKMLEETIIRCYL